MDNTFAYREDTRKRDQGMSPLGRGLPPRPDEDDPAIMSVATPTDSRDDGSYETPNS
jgi:hypothetical protein